MREKKERGRQNKEKERGQGNEKKKRHREERTAQKTRENKGGFSFILSSLWKKGKEKQNKGEGEKRNESKTNRKEQRHRKTPDERRQRRTEKKRITSRPGKSCLFSPSVFCICILSDWHCAEIKLITSALCSACVNNSRMQPATVPNMVTGLGQWLG